MPQIRAGLRFYTLFFKCTVYLRGCKLTRIPYHSVSAVGCSSGASPDDFVNALLVNGCVALWKVDTRQRGEGYVRLLTLQSLLQRLLARNEQKLL